MLRIVAVLVLSLFPLLQRSVNAAAGEGSVFPAPGIVTARPAHAATKGRADTLRGQIRREIDLSLELDRAGRLINEKRYGEAIAVLERISIAYPGIDTAAEFLAGCYLRTGRPRDAVNLLKARLRSNPSNFSFVRDLGHAYLDLGRKEKAIEVWERLLTDEEKHSSYYGTIAKLEQDAGLYEEALGTYRRGRRFKRHFLRYTREIVRLERLLERPHAAFREGLAYLDAMHEPRIEHTRFLSEIFRDAGAPSSSYIAAVDSAASASTANSRFFALFASLLLVEASRYDEARAFITGGDSHAFGADEFYSFLNALAGMDRKAAEAPFHDIFDNALDIFLARYGDSPIAPGVLLLAARYRWGEARGRGAPDSVRVREVIVLVDSVIAHPFGAAYIENAMIAKAIVQLEGLRSPEQALITLENIRWRGKEQRYRIEELRLRALLASGDWRRAKKWMDISAVSLDSTIAIHARYGLGRLAFFERNYGEAVEILSGLAEKHPASAWANDALETAMMTKAALDEGTGALDLYRAAVFAGERGEFAAAIDSVVSLRERYPASIIGPRALFLRGEYEESAGRREEAVDTFSRLAETYPLHELAPRSLERIGLLLTKARPEEAQRRFQQIMTRYPNDPFLERVRMHYMALRKSIDGGGE